MSDKVIALRTLMVRGMAFMEGQEIPFLEKIQIERLLDAGAIEVVKTRKARKKKKVTKTQTPESRVIDIPLSDSHIPDKTLIEDEVRNEVVEEDTIALDQLDF